MLNNNASLLNVPCKSFVDCSVTTSHALGLGGFKPDFKMGTYTKDFIPGVSFAGNWVIVASSTVVP